MKRDTNKKPFNEDTIKRNGKWVNVGKDGKANSGKFRTKKAADAQRKAMFANGYKGESYNAKGYSAVPGRDREVSDKGLQRVLDIAKKVDPEAKCDFDDDLIYHDGAWWILLDGDERVYDSDSYNSAYDKLLRDVEKAINDAADKYWDEVKARRDFFLDDDGEEAEIDRAYHDASEDELRKMGAFDNLEESMTGYDESLVTEAPDMFGLPTDDELEVEYQKRKDRVAKQGEKAQAKYDSAKSLPVSKIIDKGSKSFTKDAAIKKALLDIGASYGLSIKQTFDNYYTTYSNMLTLVSMENDNIPIYTVRAEVGFGVSNLNGRPYIKAHIRVGNYASHSNIVDLSVYPLAESITIGDLFRLVSDKSKDIANKFDKIMKHAESLSSKDSDVNKHYYRYEHGQELNDFLSALYKEYKLEECSTPFNADGMKDYEEEWPDADDDIDFTDLYGAHGEYDDDYGVQKRHSMKEGIDDSLNEAEDNKNESYSDDWSDTLGTGGEPTYCPVCGVRFMTVDDGYRICPECHKTPHEIAQLKRREFIYDDEPYDLKTEVDVGEKK